MTVPSACPEAEVLAAFIDGRPLRGTRDEIVSHLARCAFCTATVAEASRHRDDSAAAAPSRAARRRPSTRTLAAFLTMAAAVLLWVRAPRSPQAVSSRDEAPAWMDGSRWNTPSDRLRFAGARSTTRAVWLGLHVGSLDGACRGPAREAEVVRARVLESLSGSDLAAWRTALAEGAACDASRAWPTLDGTVSRWLDLGRLLERLRIATEQGAVEIVRREREALQAVLQELELTPPQRRALADVVAAEALAAGHTPSGLQEAIAHALDVLLS